MLGLRGVLAAGAATFGDSRQYLMRIFKVGAGGLQLRVGWAAHASGAPQGWVGGWVQLAHRPAVVSHSIALSSLPITQSPPGHPSASPALPLPRRACSWGRRRTRTRCWRGWRMRPWMGPQGRRPAAARQAAASWTAVALGLVWWCYNQGGVPDRQTADRLLSVPWLCTSAPDRLQHSPDTVAVAMAACTPAWCNVGELSTPCHVHVTRCKHRAFQLHLELWDTHTHTSALVNASQPKVSGGPGEPPRAAPSACLARAVSGPCAQPAIMLSCAAAAIMHTLVRMHAAQCSLLRWFPFV